MPIKAIDNFWISVFKNKATIFKIIIVFVVFIVACILASDDSNESQQVSNTKGVETSSMQVSDNKETDFDELTEKETEMSTSSETENQIKAVSYEAIFAPELMENWDKYVGEYIQTTLEYDRGFEKDSKMYSKYFGHSGDYEVFSYLTIYLQNYSEFNEGEYITIAGIVDEDKYTIKEADIICTGDEAENEYNDKRIDYEERKEVEAQEIEKDFKETAESPTYDDLIRYPDSYKERKIKISCTIVRVEPDGLILDGDIEAKMAGEQIALYDGRKTKEPKLREGDSVTIYGYGKGTTTVKVKDVSGIIPKTVDKYSIPAIDIRYIEFN